MIRKFLFVLVVSVGWSGGSSAYAQCGPEQARLLLRPAHPDVAELAHGPFSHLVKKSFDVDLAYAKWLDARDLLARARISDEAPGIPEETLLRLQRDVKKSSAAFTKLQRERHSMLRFMREADAPPNAALLKDLGDQILGFKTALLAIRHEELKFQAIHDYLPTIDAQRAVDHLRLIRRQLDRSLQDLAKLRAKYAVEDTRYPILQGYPKQLTGKDNIPGEPPRRYETPDPALFRSADQTVTLYGSGKRYYEYPSIFAMLRGETRLPKQLEISYPDGSLFNESTYHSHEASWDNVVYQAPLGFYHVPPERMPPSGDPTRLIAYDPSTKKYSFMHLGALSPRKFRQGALPTDPAHTDPRENWTRRRFAAEKKVRIADPRTGEESNWDSYDHFVVDFVKRNPDANYGELARARGREVWQRHERDLFNEVVPRNTHWTNHSYGSEVLLGRNQEVLLDEKGHARIRGEMVITEPGRAEHLSHTKVYEAALVNHYQMFAAEKPHVIIDTFGPEGRPYGGTERSFNPEITLGEGLITASDPVAPKHIQTVDGAPPSGKTYALGGFATDDYATDRYRLAIATQPFRDRLGNVGEVFQPVIERTADGRFAIKDFGMAMRKLFAMSWGPSRPYFFKVTLPDGTDEWYCMFHYVDETVVPEGLDPRRNPSPEEIDAYFRNVGIVRAHFHEIGDQLYVKFFRAP